MSCFYGFMGDKKNNEKTLNILKKYIRIDKVYKDNNIYLLNYNLEITDLNEKYILLYDGFIFNKNELKQILKNNNYHTNYETDEEIIILLYIVFKEKMLKYLNGFFSIAIYETKSKKFFLAIDSFGINNIFYYTKNNNLIFSNSFNFINYFNIKKEIDKNSIISLFSPIKKLNETIFKKIYKLSPGCFLTYFNKNLNEEAYFYFKINDKKISLNKINKLSKNNLTTILKSNIPSCIFINTIFNDIQELNIDKNFFINKDKYSFCYLKKYKNKNTNKIVLKDKYNANIINIKLDNIYFFDILERVVNSIFIPLTFDYYRLYFSICDLIKKNGYNIIINEEIIYIIIMIYKKYNNIKNNNLLYLDYDIFNKNIINRNDIDLYFNNNDNFEIYYKIMLDFIFTLSLTSKSFDLQIINHYLDKEVLTSELLKKNIDSFKLEDNFIFSKNYSKEYTQLLEEKIIKIINKKNNKIKKILNIDYIQNIINMHGENLNSILSYQEFLAYIIQIEIWLNKCNINFDF